MGRSHVHFFRRLSEARLIGTVYNFCTPHASLAHIKAGTTPAMAAGITDHCWSVRELLSFHVPPPRWTPPTQRGRPSRALKRLMEYKLRVVVEKV